MNRKLLIAIACVLLFAIAVIIWFFVYATPQTTPSLGKTNNPLAGTSFKKGFQFIFNGGNAPIQNSTTEVTLAKPEVLTEIWNKPATGQTFITKAIIQEVEATSTQGTTTITVKKLVNATSTILLFVDRTTGYVYAYNREIQKTYQISNTTIPGIYDAYIFNNGKRIILRYADNEKHTIVGVLATIPDVSENEQAKPLENTTYLPSQVTSVVINKKGTLASYLVTGDSGSAFYTITPKGALFIASSPFREWTLSYGGDTLYATSKPSAYLEGQTVSLPSFEFIIGGKTGLITNPYEGGILLNSMWSSTGLKTFLSKGGQQLVLDIQTLPSKCAWGQKTFLICAVPNILKKGDEGLPDDWFQGRFTFDDSFMVIDIKSGQSNPLFTFPSSKGEFDVVSISLSNDNSFIAFNRKNNASLWLLDTNLLGD